MATTHDSRLGWQIPVTAERTTRLANTGDSSVRLEGMVGAHGVVRCGEYYMPACEYSHLAKEPND